MSYNRQNCNENPKITRPHWSDSEIQALQVAYEKYGPNWKLIQQELPGRSIQQCVQKWKRIKPIELTKQCRWSEIEDCKLKDLYLQYGSAWNLIAQKMGNRNSVQVRQRYMNQLNPNKKRGKWTQEEDDKLLDLFQKVGSKWAYIGQQLGGRTDNDVKNRFYSKKNSKIANENQLNQVEKISKKHKLNDDNQNCLTQLQDIQQSSITDKKFSSIHSNQNSIQDNQEQFDPQESELIESEHIFYQSLSDQYYYEQMNSTNNALLNLGQWKCTLQSSFHESIQYEASLQLQSWTISSTYATSGNTKSSDEFFDFTN